MGGHQPHAAAELACVARGGPRLRRRAATGAEEASASAFEDFPPDAWVFLTDLEAENTTAFFDANRRRNDGGIASPSKGS